MHVLLVLGHLPHLEVSIAQVVLLLYHLQKMQLSQDRKHLFNNFQADVCDMELVGILMTAKLFNLPVLSIKGVSDSYQANVQDFEVLAYKSASIAVKIILNIIENI